MVAFDDVASRNGKLESARLACKLIKLRAVRRTTRSTGPAPRTPVSAAAGPPTTGANGSSGTVQQISRELFRENPVRQKQATTLYLERSLAQRSCVSNRFFDGIAMNDFQSLGHSPSCKPE